MQKYANERLLNLNDNTFAALKTDFNAMLKKTLSNMELKESDAAELTIKLKITLTRENSPFGEALREIVVPRFDHKVSTVMQIKDEASGTLGGDYELILDRDTGEWIMREINNGQQSMFDEKHECGSEGDAKTPSESPGWREALHGATPNKRGCFDDFPACLCTKCINSEDDGSCCATHGRDCLDSEPCPDYKKKGIKE